MTFAISVADPPMITHGVNSDCHIVYSLIILHLYLCMFCLSYWLEERKRR